MTSRDSRAVFSLFTPRFVGRIGAADLVSLSTACLGILAIFVASVDTGLAARLILFAAIMDAIDGTIARAFGGSPAGELFDSLSDAVAFGAAPAVFVMSVVHAQFGLSIATPSFEVVVAVVAVLAYVSMAVVRLALYTAYDTEQRGTLGMQTTLAATFLTAGYLAGVLGATALLVGAVVCAYLMSIRIPYPDLHLRDALVVGVIQFGTVVAWEPYQQWFALGVFGFAILYATLSPRYYGTTCPNDSAPESVDRPVDA